MKKLCAALQNRDASSAEKLVKRNPRLLGAEVDTLGDTPLQRAVWAEHPGTVRLLLSKGAQVNSRDRSGQPPLYYAKKYRPGNIVELLERHGAKE
ncbi:MAG: ankyrin repeat domain-containing protein [Candidatus Eremiobacteraeota bacterium]|nr:ankyrin repeat domain-containing protein [Candidatus Eremiobacteraeota bacterium]